MPSRPRSLSVNDGSGAPPRLLVMQAMWGMRGLPRPECEWSDEEKLDHIAAAGFDGADIDVPLIAGDEARWLAATERLGLRLGVQALIEEPEQLTAALAVAERVRAPYLEAQVGSYFTAEPGATALLKQLCATAKRGAVPLFVQTHRGRVTQDLLRTVGFLDAVPDLRLCLDLSHYVVGGALGDDPGGEMAPEAEAALDALFRRAAMLDGRVSSGHQVQVDVAPDGASESDEPARVFARLWRRAMTCWLRAAAPGDCFVFRVELGPPPYAIRAPDGRELSDRWAQAQTMRALAVRVWNEAVRAAGVGARYGA